MKKITTILTTIGLLGAIVFGPAFAGKNDNNDMRKNYQEHYKQRHQMNIDMMQMLSETMTILRDINHKPSAEEKARLGDMIKQLDGMMAKHKEMGGMMMKHKDKMRGKNMMNSTNDDSSN